MCSWRLHLDAEASADALLCTSVDGRRRSQQQQACLNTQRRSWDNQGRMLVQFETVGAAKQALEAVVGLVGLAASAGPAV